MTLKVCKYMEGTKVVAISGCDVYCSQELHDRYEAGERLEVSAIRLPTHDEMLENLPVTPVEYQPQDTLSAMRYLMRYQV